MKHKIETHLHTTYVSHCGWLGAQALIRMYKECGYSALCVTDHYNRDTFRYLEIDTHNPPDDLVDRFLMGYHMLKKEAEEYAPEIKIIEGAELRFDGSDNDYLLFGYHHDLLRDPEEVISGGLEKFIVKSRADGAVLIQAHPYREKCYPMPPELLDGVEILNCNPRHDSQNDMARKFAQDNHFKIVTAGSDCHRPGDQGTTGLISEICPEDTFAMAELLRSGNYELIERSEEH